MTRLLLLLPLLFPLTLPAQTLTQTLRGTVTDAVTAHPLPGATVVLLNTTPPLGTSTDSAGDFILGNVPVGRYQLQVSYLGYEVLTLAEIQLSSGRQTVQDVQLRERSESLGEVVVQAQGRGAVLPHPVSVRTITVEEQFRFPATFYDPARLASSYPGVATQDDQANHISIRGNSPNAVRWRLEGVDIVNPNHTANAGNFSDRPSSAGGGVNILSAQVLGTSSFLTGAFPAGYGNVLGGVLDMRFREGNDCRQQYVAQAGLIGLEVAVEGPLGAEGGRSKVEGGLSTLHPLPSYLINYRYSFTGLLGVVGIDFGGEEIAFQDVSFHLNFPTKNAGEFGLFGLGGKSKNIFRSPLDSAKITEDKERFDIDFHSQMGAIGLTHVLPIGKKTVLRSVAAISALEHQRTADLVAFTPEKMRWDEDDISESKLAFSSIFSKKINARQQLRAGLQATLEGSTFRTLYTDNFGASELAGELDGWLLQPFAEWVFRLSPNLEWTMGLRLSHFTFAPNVTPLEPRTSLSFSPNERQRFSLAYGLHSQAHLPQVYAVADASVKHGLGLLRSHHAVAAWRQTFKSLVLTTEIYYQHLFDVPVSALPADNFSVVNLAGYDGLRGQQLTTGGTARNYGLDVSLQRFFTGGSYGLASGSVYRSLYTAADGKERPTRWDGRYLVSLTSGREKVKEKNGRIRTWGANSRIVWLGGFFDRQVAVAASEAAGRTVFLPGNTYSERLGSYFRFDLRLYLRWERPGRSSLLSLDIQNLFNEENDAYRFYDSVQQRSMVRKQLGLIPVLSWRGEF